jgi:DNA-binding CsgD family transcriptional regulator
MNGRLLRVLDAAYDTDLDDEGWLRRLAESAAPLLDEGCGVHAVLADLHQPLPMHAPILVGGEPEWQACWRAHWWDELMAVAPADAHRAMLRFGAVSHTTELFAAVAAKIETFADLLGRMEERGYQHALARERKARAQQRLFYPDSLNVVSLDASGVGVVLVANRRAPVTHPLPGATRRQLTRLAGHLAAATRLRRRVGRKATPTAGAEAIAASDGRILHVEGAAATSGGLTALREAAREVVRARQGQVADPTEHWRALHAGRWTLVERFESDGRRILVARENRTAAMSLEGLTPRERQVLAELAMGQSNKEIAYRLGVTPSTVATHLQRVMEKVGARDVRELVRLARRVLDRGAHG